MEFIYGWDPNEKTFVIVTERGADSVLAVRECRTWGQYAVFLHRSLTEMIEEYELEGITADSPFSITENIDSPGVVFVDPRTDAYDVLIENLRPEVRYDVRLEGKLEWHHGSPAGHLECVDATSEEAIRILERVLFEAGRRDFVFRRDDALIQDVVYGW